MIVQQLSSQLANQTTGPTLSDEEFAAIASFTHRTYGLNLVPSKREMVFARLIKRIKKLGISDFKTYLEFVMSDHNIDERSEFLSALTTNVTHFFREAHHFAYLRDRILADLLDRAKSGKKIRIWSAGCSAGQEAYSIAMTILGLNENTDKFDIKILATDIDPRILETAKKGIYPQAERSAIPMEYAAFLNSFASNEGYFEISAKAKSLITFAELNLISDWPMHGPFDIIFCRNVAIYFDAETQSTLWKRFCDYLPTGGYLFIGHSERVSDPAAKMLKTIGVTAYVKHAAETTQIK
jgi:chemotaxis protein methyltransferase CheR